MVEIADPMTIGLIAATTLGGAALAKNMAGDQKPPTPVTDVKHVVGSLGEDEASRAEKMKRRQKLQLSVLTKDWDEPILGKPGLLGLS